MAIDKVSGTSWSSLSEINDTAKSSISKFADVDAPSGTPVTGYEYYRFVGADSSGSPTTSNVMIQEIEFYDGVDGVGAWYTPNALTSNTSDSNLTVSAGYNYSGYNPFEAFDHDYTNVAKSWWSLGVSSASDNWMQIRFNNGAVDPSSVTVWLAEQFTNAAKVLMYGSNTGAFSGEETLLATFTDSGGSVIKAHTVNLKSDSRGYELNDLLMSVEFNEWTTANTVWDYSSNGWHMESVNGASVTTQDGIYVNDTDAIDDYWRKRFTSDEVGRTGSYSAEVWFYCDMVGDTRSADVMINNRFTGQKNHLYQHFYAHPDYASSTYQSRIRNYNWDTYYTTSLPYTSFYSNASYFILSPQADYRGQWVHYVATCEFVVSGTTLKTPTLKSYINGSLVASGTNTAATTNLMAGLTFNANSSYPVDWTIGLSGGSYQKSVGYYSTGDAELRFYDTALTATQVLGNYNGTKAKYGL